DNTGPGVAIDSKGVPGDNYGFVVTNNNFFGNSLAYGSKISLASDSTTYVGQPDERNNYWGSSTGPGGDGPGTGDKVYGMGYDVYNAVAGEWLAYTRNLAQGGVFSLDTRLANALAGGSFHVEIDGQNVTGALAVPQTGNAQSWTTINYAGISLTAGQHTLRY